MTNKKSPGPPPGLNVERAPSNLRKTSELPAAYLLLGVPKSILPQLSVGFAFNQLIAGFPVTLGYLLTSLRYSLFPGRPLVEWGLLFSYLPLGFLSNSLEPSPTLMLPQL